MIGYKPILFHVTLFPPETNVTLDWIVITWNPWFHVTQFQAETFE